jgi:GNAT superfamily N-acetyltransferase
MGDRPLKDDYIIRRGELRDARRIADCNIAMAQETEHRALDMEIALLGTKAVLKDPRKGFYLVAERQDRIVGQLMVTYEWSDWRNRNFWWIQSVYMVPEARGVGIFGALYRHLSDLARYHKDVAGLRLYVEKNNAKARRVYENLNMTESFYAMYELEF